MTATSLVFAAILLIAVPTVEFGGLALLRMIGTRDPGYLDNPVRRHLSRAGHAHAGVWIVLALVAMLYVDRADLAEPVKMVVRICFGAAPILMPLGFFLSVIPPTAERPSNAIALVYVGGLLLAVGTVTLGIGLFLSL